MGKVLVAVFGDLDNMASGVLFRQGLQWEMLVSRQRSERTRRQVGWWIGVAHNILWSSYH